MEYTKVENKDLLVATKKDGKKYTKRISRSRFFFPGEWRNFISEFILEKEKIKSKRKTKKKIKPIIQRKINRLLFVTQLQTGGRIDEILHIKRSDFDFDRTAITLRVTKTKAKKGESIGKPRTIRVSKKFLKEIRRYIKSNKVDYSDYLFVDNEKILKLENKNDIKNYFKFRRNSLYQLMRRKLTKSGIKDPYNFGTHNIRKTCGMWLKALGVPSDEICKRLGHDMNTYLSSYSSPSIFKREELPEIVDIMGKIYSREDFSSNIF